MDPETIQFFSEMSHYELLDSLSTQRSIISNDLAVFMTALFAYLSAAYFVGARLSRFQAASVSVLYSILALYIIFGLIDSQLTHAKISYAITGEDISFVSLLTLGILLSVWVFSIVLSIQARRSGDT